ncbi:NACHT domain-containing NTPase [Streptomyces sp. R28]|uniref:NACHT domain-containing NTPase n=1 Tax=Streptomyces sp. R28 TaxID=3238628 RepID=A0AB39Q0B8_9ACTN
MAAPLAGPIADFCTELHRLVRKCRVPQAEIAEALGLSAASVSELLNGRRRKAPDWQVVRRIVGLCAQRYGPGAPQPLDTNLDVAWWRGRHAELERAVEMAHVPVPSPTAPVPSEPVVALGVADCVDMGLDEAVYLLAGRRSELMMSDSDHLLRTLNGEQSSVRVLDELLRDFPQRVRSARGIVRITLLQAARVVLVAAAVMRREPTPEDALELIQDLANVAYPAYVYAWERGNGYASPLAGTRGSITVETAQELDRDYVKLATPLAVCCPEFALAAGLPCIALNDWVDGRAGTGLAGLGALLAEFASRSEPPAASRAQLRIPIASLDSTGPLLPSLAEGYVNPRFRRNGPSPNVRDGIASDKWWEQQPSYDAFERFLGSSLLSFPALLSPLVVLGHPGAGKSLLTKLLKARLPTSEFRPLRVELRHTPADSNVQTQLEHALREGTGRSVSWPDWSEAEPEVIPVVLLDGFDELLQAGAQRLDSARQWGYLRDIEQFQQREAVLGRPVIVIVTSRTVVADRAEIPKGSHVLRLEPFEMPEIDRWLSVWNAKNSTYLKQCDLRPLTREVVQPHQDLAAQPLLLLMLALYDAVGNALYRLGDEDMSRTQLYERLLTEFVRRQVDKDGSLPPAEQAVAVDRELHRLSVIALGMFHRGAQSISGEEVDRDLRALGAAAADEEPGGSGLLFGRFFFVHEAQAVVTEQRLRSYEFMHATFGEYLATRLIERALRRMGDFAGHDGRSALDDGELYSLLSFIPLTDRAQLVENLCDMLATWPAGRARRELPDRLAELFRAAKWEAGTRSDGNHTPIRVTRTYRDAVYEVNLVLIGAVAAGEVHASQFLGTGELIDNWRRHAMLWRSQLSDESWDLLSSTLRLHRCWEPDPRGVDEQRPDLKISTRSTLSFGHDIGWPFGVPEGSRPPYLRMEDDASRGFAANVFTQITFLGDHHSELLLHTADPLLRRMPSTLLTYRSDRTGQLRSAAQALITLLTRQVNASAGLPDLYAMCLDSTELLSSEDVVPYLEAVSRQLAHDIPALSDETLVSVLRKLHRSIERLGRFPAVAKQPIIDCVYNALGRRKPEVTTALAELQGLLMQHGRANGRDFALLALLRLVQASRSSSTWAWSGMPRGRRASEYFDDILGALDVADVATRHPSALIAFLRTAADLNLDDWLAAHAAELIGALPSEAFGLLRPSDLCYLRKALPPGRCEAEFAELESVWR